MEAMRPRFELVVPLAPDEVFARLDAQLACPGCPCRAIVVRRTIGGDVRRSTIEVEIVERLRHVWSPRLQLEVSEHPTGARVHGLFGPNPGVWTGIVAGYAFLGLASLFATMLGLAQLSLDVPATGLRVLPVTAVLATVPYLASQVGQARAAEQMHLLRCFLGAVLGVGEPAPTPSCPPVPLRPADGPAPGLAERAPHASSGLGGTQAPGSA